MKKTHVPGSQCFVYGGFRDTATLIQTKFVGIVCLKIRILERLLCNHRDQLSVPVKSSADHVHLLFACEPHEIHGITRDSNRQIWVFVRVVHRVDEHVAVQHVNVHVKTSDAEEGIQHAAKIVNPIGGNSAEAFGN